jgi:prolyl oligopeptidase
MTATSYPDPMRQDLSEEIGGRLVADPYRWLEDPSSDETTAWLAAQDALYADHLSALPGREALAGRIGELLAAGTVGVPAWRGSRQFFTRRMPGQEHSVLYTASPDDGERCCSTPPRPRWRIARSCCAGSPMSAMVHAL